MCNKGAKIRRATLEEWRKLVFIITIGLSSNNVFSQEMCNESTELIFGNPYEISSADENPYILSVAFKSEIRCITKSKKIENLFATKSSELLTKYISLSMPWDENKKPRYCLKNYPFENNPSNFENYQACETKRLDNLNLKHSAELRILFFSLIK